MEELDVDVAKVYKRKLMWYIQRELKEKEKTPKANIAHRLYAIYSIRD